jgi:hypothetical protein
MNNMNDVNVLMFFIWILHKLRVLWQLDKLVLSVNSNLFDIVLRYC